MPQVNEFAALVDARGFGAQGDGVNDDGPHIQAAIDFLFGFGGIEGAACYLPPGRYLILTPVTVRNGITIAGAGDDSIVLLGHDTADRSLNAFTVADGDTAGFASFKVQGPSVLGVFTVRFVNKLGSTGAVVLSAVTAVNPANAPVRVPVGNRFVLENCSEVAEDFYPVTGATATLTHAGDALWTGGNWPRRTKGTAVPTAGAGVPASEGSIYQRFVAGAGELWLKTGAADTAWTMVAAGPAGGTLQTAYNLGPPVSITLDPVLGGVFIIDSTPAQGAGNPLFGVSNAGSTVRYFSVEVSAVSAFSRINISGDAGMTKEIVFARTGSPDQIRGANATVAPQSADDINIFTGNGANSSAIANAGNGGQMFLGAGAGGATTDPATTAGFGGGTLVAGGSGGAGSAAQPAGAGGAVTILGGGAGVAPAVGAMGGAISIAAGGSTGTAAGADVTVTAGAPGAAASQAGSIFLRSLAGGALPGVVAVQIGSSTLNAAVDAMTIEHRPTLATSAGTGTRVSFIGKNGAGTQVSLGRFDFSLTNVGAGTEASTFGIWTRTAGAAAVRTWSVSGSTVQFDGAIGTFTDAFIKTANAVTPNSVVALNIQGGNGAAATGGAAATLGGVVNLTGGAGGAASAAFAGAQGGTVLLTGGVGGVASAAQAAGVGGPILFNGGTGGAGNAAIPGGAGGGATLTGGTGGAGTAGAIAGAGGGFVIAAGDSGASGGGGLGNGGAVSITGGAGATGGGITLTGGTSNVTAVGSNIVLDPGNGATSSGFVDVLINDAVGTISDAVRMRKVLAGAGAAGLGIATIYNLDNSASTETTAARMSVSWTTATAGAETAVFTFSALLAGVMTTVATLTPTTGALFTVNDAAIVTVTDIVTMQHFTSGAAGVNYGTGLLYQGENAAGTTADMGRLAFSWTDATAASEDSVLRVSTRTAGGALAQVAAFENARAVVPTAYQIGTEATTQWSITVVAPTATYTVANQTFNHAFTQTTAATSGAHTFYKVTSAQNTNQTLSTEIPAVQFDLSAGRQWATGAISVQRAFIINAPTYSFVGASTISLASTLYTSQPVAGTNATLTSTVPAWFEQSTALTATSGVDALLLSHQTSGAAANNFGVGQLWQLEDSAGALVNASRFVCTWTVANAATVTSQMDIHLRSGGAALASVLVMTPTLATFSGGVVAASTVGSGGFRVGAANALVIQQVTAGNYGFSLLGSTATSGIFTWSSSNATAAPSWIFRQVAKAALTSESIGVQFDFATNAFQTGAGVPVYATQRMITITAPTFTASGAATLTNVNMLQIDTPVVGTNMTVTNMTVTSMGTSAVIGPSGTTTTYSVKAIPAHTITYSVATGSTAACGVAGVRIDQITVAQNTGAGTLTVTNAASLYISNAPVAGTGSAITNAYAIFVDAGLARFDGNGTRVFELPADATAGVTALNTGRVPVLIGGTTFYLRYFVD